MHARDQTAARGAGRRGGRPAALRRLLRGRPATQATDADWLQAVTEEIAPRPRSVDPRYARLLLGASRRG